MRFLLAFLVCVLPSAYAFSVNVEECFPAIQKLAVDPEAAEHPMVIKLGGNEAEDPEFLARLAEKIAAQSERPVIVHGGGKSINRVLEQMGEEPKYHPTLGQRITDDVTMDVVQMVLGGPANKRLVRALGAKGIDAQGMSGEDRGGLIKSELLNPELGHVGKPISVNADAIREMIRLGVTPVIAPISAGPEGKPLNVNADWAATAVAAGLKSKEITFLTNVPGVMLKGEVVRTMTVAEVRAAIESGEISGGMIPKVEAALNALDAGVESVRIANLDSFEKGGTRFVRTPPEAASEPSATVARDPFVQGLPKTPGDIAFDMKHVVAPSTLAVIKRWRNAPEGTPWLTVQDKIGTALAADPAFAKALKNTSREELRENWDLLMTDLLNPNTPEEKLGTMVTYAKLDFLRDYFTAHRGAMMQISEILESDPKIAELEQALFKAEKDTLMMRLIINRDKPVSQVIEEALRELGGD